MNDTPRILNAAVTTTVVFKAEMVLMAIGLALTIGAAPKRTAMAATRGQTVLGALPISPMPGARETSPTSPKPRMQGALLQTSPLPAVLQTAPREAQQAAQQAAHLLEAALAAPAVELRAVREAQVVALLVALQAAVRLVELSRPHLL